MKLSFARLLPQQDLMPCNATDIVKLNITDSESRRSYTPNILSLRITKINDSQFRIVFCGLLLSQRNRHRAKSS